MFADLEPDAGAADGTNDAMDVARIATVEQHEQPAVLVAQAAVDLHDQTMGLLAGEVVVVDGDPLAAGQSVRRQLDAIVERHVENRRHRSTHRREMVRGRHGRHTRRKRRVEHVELVLLVEIGLHEPPGRAGLEPLKKRRFKVPREATPREEVAERPSACLDHLDGTVGRPFPGRRHCAGGPFAGRDGRRS